MGTTTWSFGIGNNGWSFEDRSSPSNIANASRTWVPGALQVDLHLDAVGIERRATGVNFKTGFEIAYPVVASGDKIEADYSATSTTGMTIVIRAINPGS